MINNVTLTGNLTKDIELRYLGNGTAVTNFTIAVQRTFKNAQGEYDTDFIRCIAWRQTAEFMSKYMDKGARIGLTGAIRTGSYDKDGQTVYTTEVEVDNAVFLESRKEKEERTGGQQAQQQSQGYDNQKPTTNENPFKDVDFEKENPFASKGEAPTNISDDDLPF